MDMRAARKTPELPNAPRTGGPVERFLEPGRPIVTKTDLKGCITYANPAFVALSGFEREELIGANHNIVRHADMPPAAFADLWRTVGAGLPWRGIVKNRAKNGDYYWVDAYVTPLTRNGERIGYMSVRTPPTAAARTQAEALYRDVQRGVASVPATAGPGGMPLSALTAGGFAMVCMLALVAALIDGPLKFMLLAAMVVAAVAGWFLIRRSILEPLQTIQGVFGRIAEGQLRNETPATGCREVQAVGTGLRSMQVSLRALIGDVVASADGTAKEAAQLHAAARRLQEGSRQQAEEVASSASAMQQLAVSVGEIAAATDNSAEQARGAQQITVEGQENMRTAAASTARVVDAVDENRRMLDALSGSVAKIGDVASSISQIAKRTNLLALNAAIEAARAGEQGRGFAVVAGEVTELAGQTQCSTDDIVRLIAEIAERNAQVADAMNVLMAGVDDSVKTITAVAGELELLSRANDAVATNSDDVRHMLHQQEQASSEVANIMQRMSSITDTNLTTVGGVEEAAAALEVTARELQLLVAHFESRL